VSATTKYHVCGLTVWPTVQWNQTTMDTAVAKATLAPSIRLVSKEAGLSILEIQNRAYLENLPVQQIDDKTLIFTAKAG